MAGPPPDLQKEFFERVAKAMEAFGLEFESTPIVLEFQDRGVPRATVYRWLKAAKAGQPVRVLKPKDTAPPPRVAGDVAAKLPPVPKVSDVESKGLLPVVALLRDCISHAEDLIKHARTKEGAVRNARLLMQASEHLRKAIETAARLNETIAAQQEMERFHAALLEEIRKEAPDLQQRILIRLKKSCEAALSDA